MNETGNIHRTAGGAVRQSALRLAPCARRPGELAFDLMLCLITAIGVIVPLLMATGVYT